MEKEEGGGGAGRREGRRGLARAPSQARWTRAVHCVGTGEGRGPSCGARCGRLLGRLLWAWPSEQCLFRIKSNSLKGT
jgi:hypothetical protein